MKEPAEYLVWEHYKVDIEQNNQLPTNCFKWDISEFVNCSSKNTMINLFEDIYSFE